MQLFHKPKRRPYINITSLIDVLFLLLTFFLVTTSFIEQSALKVELPSMEHADRVQQPKRFVLDVAPDGEIRYDGEPVELAALGARLQTASNEINAGGGLVLRADREPPPRRGNRRSGHNPGGGDQAFRNCDGDVRTRIKISHPGSPEFVSKSLYKCKLLLSVTVMPEPVRACPAVPDTRPCGARRK